MKSRVSAPFPSPVPRVLQNVPKSIRKTKANRHRVGFSVRPKEPFCPPFANRISPVAGFVCGSSAQLTITIVSRLFTITDQDHLDSIGFLCEPVCKQSWSSCSFFLFLPEGNAQEKGRQSALEMPARNWAFSPRPKVNYLISLFSLLACRLCSSIYTVSFAKMLSI